MATLPNPNTDLSLQETGGRERLQATLTHYVNFLHQQPAICGSAQQQEALIQHVAQGHELIKLVSAERLKITRQLDDQKQDWMELEKELTAPLLGAMQPLKDAVEHYNREMLRIRAHQQAEVVQQSTSTQASQTDWLRAEVPIVALPKGVHLKWTFEVVDPDQVPKSYWVIDEGAIKTAVAQGARTIAGVRIYEEAVTSFRA